MTGTGIDSLGSTDASDRPRSYQVTSLSYTHVSVDTIKRSLKRCRTLTKVSLHIYYSQLPVTTFRMQIITNTASTCRVDLT